MAIFNCGDRLKFGRFAPGTSGCLVRFPDFPDRVLLLAAGHVVLPPFAQQGDAITAEGTDELIGRLFTWTTIDGIPTTDAALIWVDPAKVSPRIRGLGAPKEINLQPAVGDLVRIVPHDGQQAPREARIRALAEDISVMVIGPGWDSSPTITYRGQILTDRQMSEGGDSGAIAVDSQGRVVGMVVAGSVESGTVITPIAAILKNAAWGGLQLELVSEIGSGAVAPAAPAALPDTQPADERQIAFGKRVSEEFKIKVMNIAAELQLDVDHLMAAMAFETGGTFDPAVKNSAGSGATGLIQFMPATAVGLGTTTDELSRMTAVDQLDFVREYFLPHKGKLKELEDVYMAILFPKAIGKSNNFVLFSQPSKAYEQNKGLDSTQDGDITKAEAAARVRAKLNEGMKLSNIG